MVHARDGSRRPVPGVGRCMRVAEERGRAAPAPQATIFGQFHPLRGFAARREGSGDIWSVVTDSVRVSNGEASDTHNALWTPHVARRTPGGGGTDRKLLPGVQAPRDLALRRPSCSAQPQERGDAIHRAHRRSSLRSLKGNCTRAVAPLAISAPYDLLWPARRCSGRGVTRRRRDHRAEMREGGFVLPLAG